MRKATTAALLVSALVAGATAASASHVHILEPSDLAVSLSKVTVLDARDEKDFLAGHVPGSRHVDWKDFTEERPGLVHAVTGDPARWGKVAPPSTPLQERLRDLGLSNEKPVVVVGSPNGWGEEGRIAWCLLAWGATDVALLDGGYPAWKGDVEHGKAAPAGRGDFRIRLDESRRIRLDRLRAEVAAGHARILDVRTPEEFAGKTMPGQKRGGHLPGARLVSYRSLYRADGTFATKEELLKLIGGAPDARTITYCTGGVRSALLTVLLEAGTGVAVRNYDGSLWEWSADPKLPLVAGSD